jgi:membrane fusion protein (multidrug efflux system)
LATPFTRTTRSLAQDTALGAVATWALAASLLAAWAVWFVAGSVTVYEISPRARLEVQQASHPVSAQVGGRLQATHLVLGQAVAQGDVLVELDAGEPRLRLEEERVRQQALQAQLAALQEERRAREQATLPEGDAAQAAWQGANARTQEAAEGLAYATDHERRLRDEAAQGGVATVDALQARAEMQKLAAARDALAAEARRLQASGHSRSAELRAQQGNLLRVAAALEGELAASQQATQRLLLEIDRHRVRAPVAGRIGDVAALRPGEVVGAGQKFAVVIPEGELIVVADFEPRAVLGRVRPGQPARLRLDGFPWAQYGTLAARVSRVAGEVRDGRVRVEFSPDGPWPQGVALQHGLPGTVEISIETVSPAVLVLRASGQALAGAAAP